jgi:hypothetical protein
MGRRSVVLKAIIALALVWGVVWGVRSWAASRKITAERVEKEMKAAELEDWSVNKGRSEDPAEREEEIRRVAEMINRLDFQEREKNRENRSGEEFYRKLSPEERELFVNLTVMESMNRFMEALDDLKPAQRRQFVKQALKEIEDGRTAEEMARAEALGDNLLDRISEEGMKAYFNKASADTKLDLAPLLEAMNEVMQGMRGNEFGGKKRLR